MRELRVISKKSRASPWPDHRRRFYGEPHPPKTHAFVPYGAMRLRRHVNLLESSLKHVSTIPVPSSQWNRHSFSTTTEGAQQEIAVLGGGITGLASAYYISKEFPRARITIYEAGPRLGGWLQSTHVEVPGGRVLFEHGPRTLRTGLGSLVTSHLVHLRQLPNMKYIY